MEAGRCKSAGNIAPAPKAGKVLARNLLVAEAMGTASDALRGLEIPRSDVSTNAVLSKTYRRALKQRFLDRDMIVSSSPFNHRPDNDRSATR